MIDHEQFWTKWAVEDLEGSQRVCPATPFLSVSVENNHLRQMLVIGAPMYTIMHDRIFREIVRVRGTGIKI